MHINMLYLSSEHQPCDQENCKNISQTTFHVTDMYIANIGYTVLNVYGYEDLILEHKLSKT